MFFYGSWKESKHENIFFVACDCLVNKNHPAHIRMMLISIYILYTRNAICLCQIETFSTTILARILKKNDIHIALEHCPDTSSIENEHHFWEYQRCHIKKMKYVYTTYMMICEFAIFSKILPFFLIVGFGCWACGKVHNPATVHDSIQGSWNFPVNYASGTWNAGLYFYASLRGHYLETVFLFVVVFCIDVFIVVKHTYLPNFLPYYTWERETLMVLDDNQELLQIKRSTLHMMGYVSLKKRCTIVEYIMPMVHSLLELVCNFFNLYMYFLLCKKKAGRLWRRIKNRRRQIR